MTTRINLLPWREMRRQERQKQYIVALSASVAGVLVFALLVHLQILAMINYQEKRNRYLENEIALLDRKIVEIEKLEKTRQALIDRIEVIQELQANRPAVVHLFDELVKTLPDGTYLTSLNQGGKQLTLEGKAESNTRVSSYMRQLDDSAWLDQASLHFIETQQVEQIRVSRFKLNVAQTIPSRDGETFDGAVQDVEEWRGGTPEEL